MRKNIGNTDKLVRIAAGLMAGILFLISGLSGTLAITLGIAAAVLVLTATVGVCPLYMPFRFSTMRRSTKDKGVSA